MPGAGGVTFPTKMEVAVLNVETGEYQSLRLVTSVVGVYVPAGVKATELRVAVALLTTTVELYKILLTDPC